jgi:hypothetical protein
MQWSATDTAIMLMLFLAKDMLCVVDDLRPEGTDREIADLYKKASRVFRSVGNGRDRDRATRDIASGRSATRAA